MLYFKKIGLESEKVQLVSSQFWLLLSWPCALSSGFTISLLTAAYLVPWNWRKWIYLKKKKKQTLRCPVRQTENTCIFFKKRLSKLFMALLWLEMSFQVNGFPTNLYVEVDFSAPAQVWKVPSRFQVSSSGVGKQLVHFFFCLQRQSALVKHLDIGGSKHLVSVLDISGWVLLLLFLRETTYIDNRHSNIFYFVWFHIRVLTVKR